VERSQRLRKGEEFDTAYREGTVTGGPLLVVRQRANDLGTVRWGFAVGKRLAKQAVTRNLVKRRLREAARGLPVPGGHDVIVTARQGAVEASYAELRRALEQGLVRAGLLGKTGEG
jgi:ribonuclease P protein component